MALFVRYERQGNAGASSVKREISLWWKDLKNIWPLLKERTFKTRTKEEMFESAQFTSVNPMVRVCAFTNLNLFLKLLDETCRNESSCF